ncbi:MAG: hypothetical protein HWN67_04500 [Candidatus Helarchaeota archaeon]|nr:hypothetical protein [Candidatus Helarchaeota archaeon]
MTKDEIKKIMKINDEINALILKLEKKQQESSKELINIIIEKDERISELEKEIVSLKSRTISKPVVTTGKSISAATPIAEKVSLTDVLTGSEEKQPSSAGVTAVPPKVSIFSEKNSKTSVTSEASKSATMSRYGSVDVLKKRGGPSKFKPRTPGPPPKPEAKPKPEEPPPKKQNKEALAILENLKSEITEETTTHDLQKILEEVRDDLAEIIGFSSIIRDIGTVSGKLKHAPDLPMDSSSIEAFRKKVDQWKSKV